MKTDIQIANEAEIKQIQLIANKLNVSEEDLELYGKYKAKLPLSLIDEEKLQKNKLVLVTAISPTPAGEGKTTTLIGLVDGLNKIGKQASAALREPSLGPVFGIKGGAAGGGLSQVIPMEDINLHFTGDFSAIEKANNLLSAVIDNHFHQGNILQLDPKSITWKRVMDLNDRSLRSIIVGLGGKTNGIMREDGFNITAASEIMAILCLSRSFDDLKEKLANIYIGNNIHKEPVYAKQLNVVDAMAILLKDAFKPNLVQTLEGNPALVHGGPFANIAQGTNSVIATKMAMSLSEYTVTEAGFGADLGAEKFLNIKAREAGVKPDAVVVVATVRALKYHGGASLTSLNEEDINALESGIGNLKRHVENMKSFGLPVVVSINKFPNDTKGELEVVRRMCISLGVEFAIGDGFSRGGEGMKELAEKVVSVAHKTKAQLSYTYELNDSVEVKIEKIAKRIYKAKDVVFSATALKALRTIKENGWGKLPVCMAKTQKSFSDNDQLIGAPIDFEVTVREIEYSIGAGFIIPILGKIMRMPGLPKKPASENMHIDTDGKISGLS